MTKDWIKVLFFYRNLTSLDLNFMLKIKLFVGFDK